MYFDDIDEWGDYKYPRLEPVKKSLLLRSPFSQREGDSINIDDIAAYLDDYEIAMKAAELPEERLKKILHIYHNACYDRFNKCYKKALQTYDSKVHNDTVMQAATMGYIVEFLQEAINKNTPHPSHTKIIEKHNNALRILYETSRELSLEEELPEIIMSFDAFLKKKENECISYIEERTGFKLQSKDRKRRVLAEAKHTARFLYEELCDNPDSVGDMIDGYRSRVVTLATSVFVNNVVCKQEFDSAENNIMFILNEHDKHIKNP